MLSKFKQIFLNEKILLFVILINTLVIFFQESGFVSPAWLYLDLICTLFFVIEMFIKINTYSFKEYWKDNWNRFDFIIVCITTPAILTAFFDNSELSNLSVLLTLRLLRVFRLFRAFHFFPNFGKIMEGLSRALSQSKAILLGFFVIIVISGLINCCLFKNIAPEYFATPLDSIYTVFRIFTVEGWYDIPDAIAATTSPLIGKISRLYFCLLLCGGGIIGMSFVNSVFVDAMAEDNNDGVIEQLNRIEKKLEEMESKMNEINKK